MAAISSKQLAQWYEAHGTELMLYARQWSADQQAEDVVQDAFIRLLRQRKCPDNVRAWLFRVVRNCSISRTRRTQQQRRAARKVARSEGLWFESRHDDLIDAKLVQDLLKTLPADLRETVILRIWGQMSLREISHIVNKSVPWVHYGYKEALEIIRKKLEHTSCKTRKT
ncbi:MAG: sigma-70 family RNA polymerase sigma factor [Phycisphaerales bacterium]|nr:MAG: sigma-70 family RNA polymerase sigma factor [Phycisphaerales bacterium]